LCSKGRAESVSPMKAASPGVGRMIAILNLLADHPRQRFTATEMVRALKMSRATCHVLLSSLVEVGFLYRTMEKTYVLGGALARVGQIAASSLAEHQVAGPEMRALADEFDVICAAVYREGYDAIVKERAISVSHIGWPVPLPEAKYPIEPPLGSMFFAWENDSAVERWLERTTHPLTQPQRKELLRRMVITRERGYFFGIRKIKKMDEGIAKSLQFRVEQSDYLMGEVDLKRQYNLAMVGAPVLDARGKVAFLLTLVGFNRAVSGKFVVAAGMALRSACDRIAQSGYQG
jgi:DNA-binding IclR family transcriptional regulator